MCFTQREFWPLFLAPGGHLCHTWWEYLCLGEGLATPDSPRLGAAHSRKTNHVTWDGSLRSHGISWPSNRVQLNRQPMNHSYECSPSKNFGHLNSGELPCLAVPHCSHAPWYQESSVSSRQQKLHVWMAPRPCPLHLFLWLISCVLSL